MVKQQSSKMGLDHGECNTALKSPCPHRWSERGTSVCWVKAVVNKDSPLGKQVANKEINPGMDSRASNLQINIWRPRDCLEVALQDLAAALHIWVGNYNMAVKSPRSDQSLVE